uniref:TetR family transcriptional regulator n=1 Tax=Thermosporothrix sp. COM3 TaxID=2490863 RepID=A0A455SAH3_9CHLR|nr:TetR family transcriptional regulator [Thermosporothrix sp. COM3]
MPKVVDHVSYRKQLLSRCLDLFAQSGYSALTMRQIAEALQVSTGTLYHYFPTKEALFQQLVEEVTARTTEMITAFVQQDMPPEQRLTMLFRFLEQHESFLNKQLMVTLNYYQHRDLYGEDAGHLLQQGGLRYQQLLMQLLEIQDEQFLFLLQSQINGLLFSRMIHHVTVPLLEQAQPLIVMLSMYLQQFRQNKSVE